MSSNNKQLTALLSLAVALAIALVYGSNDKVATAKPNEALAIFKRNTNDSKSHDPKTHHSSMVHNHLSRKVFERACAASKDTIDEIVACFTSNENLTKNINPEMAGGCYEEAFGQKFDNKDMKAHRDMICKNREKFENMTACVYRKTTETLGPKEIEVLTEAMVDVGLCIINALD